MAQKNICLRRSRMGGSEIPFAKEVFKRWCVNRQGLTESSADVYISNIRTAFTTMFDDEDTLYNEIRNAFLSHRNDPERRISILEDRYETLVAYSETIAEFGDDWFNEYNSKFPIGKTKPVPKDSWVRAFQCYCRFIRWCIDTERHNLKIKIEVKDDPATFLEIPMKKQFRKYMEEKGTGYTTSTIDTYCSRLKRLYNLLFRRVQKHNYFESLGTMILKGRNISRILEIFKKRVDWEMDYEFFSDLSDDDVARGNDAFMVYCEFLEDFARNPRKYPIDEYEIPQCADNKKK